ncbi:DUF5320 domain-containing protein [Draconibacterium sp. IB214405]|uniref:DUF5320 domain-containing protein n=1 Tax=Draconibacterium sp. IB214405 TaxID=3097352 RepID=UPI002A125E90|nr:DUF5320 domain-containing protein [Draconibacterium sp. IB214405]MDX8339834.1 DUF5320 domain-containing protein [Draconibacterium sp. IB214405]
MPGLDKTGPMGQGTQTGRKQGRCSASLSEEQFAHFGKRSGRGFRNRNLTNEETLQSGWGRGKRRGQGRGFSRLEN